MIEVQGNAGLDGAMVLIDGPISALRQRKLTPSSEPAKNYVCRFSVPPGNYTIRIEQNGRVVQEVPSLVINDYQIIAVKLADPTTNSPKKAQVAR
jgi:hypothetical protein